ncbi:MAG: alpha/beta hydrolase [Chlamydiota bacterium]
MKKETLVLVPGFGAREIAWQHQATHLSELFDIQIMIMDNQSSREEMVDYLLKQAPEKFHLAGQSMGGWVAQAVAAKAPHRVLKLLLLDTWCSPDPHLNEIQRQAMYALEAGLVDPVIEKNISLILHPSRLNDTPLVEGIKTMIKSFSAHALARQMQAMLDDYSSLHLHGRIVHPTLILHGKEDALFSFDEQQILLKKIKNSRLAVIEECGHAAPIERPQAVTALMRYFLEY